MTLTESEVQLNSRSVKLMSDARKGKRERQDELPFIYLCIALWATTILQDIRHTNLLIECLPNKRTVLALNLQAAIQ